MTEMAIISIRKAFLRRLLASRLSSSQLAWLDERLSKISQSKNVSDLTVAIGLTPRKLGKNDLNISAEEKIAAQQLRAGFDLSSWSIDQTARVLMVLEIFSDEETAFATTIERLFQYSEITEQIALLLGLPLYPGQELLVPCASEGIRSAMQPIFEAVSHRNPFPNEQFSEPQWNQMVLKALFIGSRLAPVQGLDERRNALLAAMLMDYAHERWSAGRSISPELWRCIGPFARDEDLTDMAKVLQVGSDLEAKSVALSLSECSRPEARRILDLTPALLSEIKSKQLTWDTIQP